MGYSPLPGLVMSTRSGDLDPAIVLDLIERHGLSPSRVNQMLNKESGLVGLSGSTSDLFELLALAEAGDSRARLAVDVYCHRLKSAIGAMLAVLGGADALVFTDDIGAHAWQVREQACAGLDWLGIRIDQQRNRSASPEQVSRVSSDETRIQVLVVPADEEAVIAREGLDLLNRGEVDPDNANYEEASD
jgi:acetate kinase